jgi:predicted ATPase
MSNAKLTAISIERFKSFKQATRIELAPLTVIVGRNNSGKSSLIQSLLLLKQTLADPRPDVMLRLEGMVEAFNLREITFGRPEKADVVEGPVIELEWESEVDVAAALAGTPDLNNLATLSGVEWLRNPPGRKTLRTALRLQAAEIDGAAQIEHIELRSLGSDNPPTLAVSYPTLRFDLVKWGGEQWPGLEVDMVHFIPYLRIDRTTLGRSDLHRAWHNAYLVLFAQPLEALKSLLADLHYLGSLRQQPPSLFKLSTTTPSEIGVHGELAAALLQRRQGEIVHFLPLADVSDSSIDIRDEVLGLPLVDAVNHTMAAMSVKAPLRVEEIQDVGFRLLFGDASLVHVGRGLSYLLPLVELGLFADPLRFKGGPGSMPLAAYREQCKSFTHIALEEPEAHLHPKVASRLAHWLVSLARANRRLIVETHSDHLVRRLRGLAARAGAGSELEQWLLQNVVILSVEQDVDGSSRVASSRLTAEGGVEQTWPADFMDESADEESSIYYARLNKAAPVGGDPAAVEMVDGDEPEADAAP